MANTIIRCRHRVPYSSHSRVLCMNSKWGNWTCANLSSSLCRIWAPPPLFISLSSIGVRFPTSGVSSYSCLLEKSYIFGYITRTCFNSFILVVVISLGRWLRRIQPRHCMSDPRVCNFSPADIGHCSRYCFQNFPIFCPFLTSLRKVIQIYNKWHWHVARPRHV